MKTPMYPQITAAAYSVSMFTRFGATVDQLWLKHRVGEDRNPDRFGTAAATGAGEGFAPGVAGGGGGAKSRE